MKIYCYVLEYLSWLFVLKATFCVRIVRADSQYNYTVKREKELYF